MRRNTRAAGLKKIVIDGAKIANKSEALAVFAARLGFAPEYVANLDALYDALGETGGRICVVLKNAKALRDKTGSFADGLIAVLEAFVCENEQAEFKIL